MNNEIRNSIKEALNKYSIDSLYVIIKPSEKASYKSTIDILDEMTINNIKHFSMEDLTKNEQDFLKIDE